MRHSSRRFLAACAAAALVFVAACAGTGGRRAPEPAEVDPVVTIAESHAAIAADSTDADAWFRLGVAWQRARELDSNVPVDSARVTFERMLERWPEHIGARVHRGIALEDMRLHDEAEVEYRTAVQLAPDDPLPLINLGALLYFHFKKPYEAKQAFARALALDPNNADAHFNLGVMFADAKLFGEAEREWRRVLDLDPGSQAGQLAAENLERIESVLESLRKDPSEDDEGTGS